MRCPGIRPSDELLGSFQVLSRIASCNKRPEGTKMQKNFSHMNCVHASAGQAQITQMRLFKICLGIELNLFKFLSFRIEVFSFRF